jgi:lipopolysaccharide assembly outer membrane protein LptD (OstA)
MMAQQSIPIPSTYNSETDSIIVTPESITDSPDSVEPTVTEQKKEAAIDAKIEYTSSDSMVITGNGIAYMYGSGDLKYKSMELTADYIRVHMDSSTLYAKGVYDTIENEWVGKPVFSEGNDEYETDELTYNLRTQKGLILNAITEQGEGYILAGRQRK